MKISKSTVKWIIAAVVVLGGALFAFWFWKKKQNELPDEIAWGNGRLEAKLVDVAAKEPMRVREILVDEGALVEPGQVLVRLDTLTLDAQLAEARARIAAAQEHMAAAAASIAKQQSEIALAEIELDRSSKLAAEGAGSQRDLDVRRAALQTSRASLVQARAMLQTAKEQVEAEEASAQQTQTRIDDATLVSPVTGRVLYRLAEPGEVLGPGGKAMTIVDLEDVYMEIFLPSEQAAQAKIGSQGRIVLDYDRTRAIPAKVSFVSPEAQFTPKQVETRSEREKLMFRVKLQVPEELATEYVDRIMTGVRGVGYVRLDPSVQWPISLNNVVRPGKKERKSEPAASLD